MSNTSYTCFKMGSNIYVVIAPDIISDEELAYACKIAYDSYSKNWSAVGYNFQIYTSLVKRNQVRVLVLDSKLIPINV